MTPAETCNNRAAKIRLLALDVDGVLSDGRLYYGTDGLELKTFHTRDGLGIKMLMSTGVAVAIITARDSAIVARRAAELGITHCYQGSRDKRATLSALQLQLELEAEQVAFMGDDLPDLAAMRQAGLALTVADAAEPVLTIAHWRSSTNGGHGAVRQACEMIMRAQHTLDRAIEQFAGAGDSG